MKKSVFEKHFKFGLIEDSVCSGLNRISFAVKDHSIDDAEMSDLLDLPARAVTYKPTLPKGEYGVSTWDSGVVGLKVEIDTQSDKTIICEQYFRITESGLSNWYSIPNNEKGHLAKGMVNIDGVVYTYGMVRSVFKRIDIKQWENITTENKHPNLHADVNASTDTFVGEWVGFSAMDGFSENDIYAGGNRGDFWHYNGQDWNRIDLPINSDISTITCGLDGSVYIACRNGPVLVGRGDIWKVIDKSNQLSHSAWFDGNIYFSGDSGRIYTYKQDAKSLSRAKFKSDMPKWISINIAGIASCEECLVAYTEVQAYAYDGEIWHEIIEIPSLSKNT